MAALRQELFPVRLTIGDTTYPLSRIFVTRDGRAVAWVQHNDGQLERVGDMSPAEVAAIRTQRNTWEVTGEDTWTCRKGGGCGCGQPIRRLSREAALE